MLRKYPLLLILFALLMPVFSAKTVYASHVSKSIYQQDNQLENNFTFDRLGYSEKLLVGPFDSAGINFSLPANIKLAPGSSLSLKYALAWSGGGVSDESTGQGVGGTLLVYFNDELIDTILLGADSPLEKEISIPDEVLNKVDSSGRYGLRFFLNAEVNCEYNDVRTTVIISKNSQLNLQYDVVSPLADLSLFPRPIYQPDSILPNSALVVIADNPEAYELQAALTAVAGLGSITNGDLTVNLVTNTLLTPELVASNHLIFVGLARNFPTLQAVNFPVPITGAGVTLGQDNDGVIEVGLSPWNQGGVVMFVGGNTEEAVIKAGQAFSTGRIIAVEKPDVSVIETVNPLENTIIPEDQTFKDLGYDDQTMGLFGENYFSYVFYASPDQAASQGAYMDLVLSHSDLLDFEQTGVTVILNDEVVGGLQLTEESPSIERINLVPGVLRRGINRLEVISDIVPYFTCYSSDILSTWVTVSETSIVHLPVSENKLDIGKNINLRDFPYMFLDSRDLSNLAFILAPSDPLSWNYASRVAYYIGAKGSAPLVNLKAEYADNIPDGSLSEYNLLVFGRASTLPFISKFNDLLPAPFEPGGDEAVQPSMLVNYSLLPDTSVGYLQLLPSPWNPDHVILAVLGNTPDGIPMAGATLLKDDLVARLSGNFAVLYGDQVVSTDTRLGLSKDSIISQLPVSVTVTPAIDVDVSQTPPSEIETRPSWILPALGAITFGILVLLVIMLRKEALARKMPKEAKAQDKSGSDPNSSKNS